MSCEYCNFTVWVHKNRKREVVNKKFCPVCGEPLEQPEPLTLEQLKQMDGEPVWVVFKGDEHSEAQSHWCFVSGGDVYPCDWQTVNDYTYPLSGFGAVDTDLCAYTHKPRQGP